MQSRANSVRDTAARLNISDRKVWSLIKDGSLGSIRIGTRRLITDEQIEEFLKQCQNADLDSRDGAGGCG